MLSYSINMKKPSIVMLPAFMCTENLFREQYNKLSDKYNVIIPVLKDFSDITEAANYVLSTLPKEFFLVGISMGGYIAMEILNIAKERVKKLCLMATKIDLDTEEQKQNRLSSMQVVKSTNKVVATKSYLTSMLYNNVYNESIYTLIQNMNNSLGSSTYINQQKLILSRKSLKGKLKDFYNPTLLIAGKEDKVTSFNMLSNISAELPNNVLVTIDKCGHLIPLDQPVALNTVLEYFVKV